MKEVVCKLCGARYELQWQRSARDGWNTLYCLVCGQMIHRWSIEGYYVGILKEKPVFRRLAPGDPVS